MTQITPSASMSHDALYDILISILDDLTALKAAVDSGATVLTDAKTLANDLRNKLLGDYVDGATGLGIGSDAPKVAYGAFTYHINGQQYSKTASTAGIALSGDTVPDATYGAWALEINAAGTVAIVPAAANGTGYASSALALAGIPAQTADKARMGTVVILNAGATFVPGTTDLSAGTVTDTYADATPLLTTIGSAISSSPTAVGTLNTTA